MSNNRTMRVSVAAFVIAVTITPGVAFAQSHKASRAGVTSVSSGSTITVTKTENNSKGVFGHYIAGGGDYTTSVVSTYPGSVSAGGHGDITAINACVSNGILPSTCSNWNNVY
jgi:hypothetical protein